MQFLKQYGYTELEFGGTSLIMSDVGIEFKNELFYGDTIITSVAATDFSKVSFDLYYKLEKQQAEKTQLIATAKTGMICYDYNLKKITSVPADAQMRLTK